MRAYEPQPVICVDDSLALSELFGVPITVWQTWDGQRWAALASEAPPYPARPGRPWRHWLLLAGGVVTLAVVCFAVFVVLVAVVIAYGATRRG